MDTFCPYFQKHCKLHGHGCNMTPQNLTVESQDCSFWQSAYIDERIVLDSSKLLKEG